MTWLKIAGLLRFPGVPGGRHPQPGAGNARCDHLGTSEKPSVPGASEDQGWFIDLRKVGGEIEGGMHCQLTGGRASRPWHRSG